MPLRFFALLLLTTLAACSSQEREPQVAAIPTGAPVPPAPSSAAPPVPADPPTPPLRVASPERQWGPQVGVSTASVGRHLLQKPRVDSGQQVGGAADSLAAGQELAALYAREAKPAQLFLIHPDQDTVLRAAEGTMVLVPANAFVSAADQAPITGLVELRLREFYSLTDMVLNNLSTHSGEQLLETGGMLQIEASAAGKSCELRKGARLLLRLPATRPRPDMQLFKGVPTANAQQLDWQTPAPQLSMDLSKIQPPKFVHGNGVMQQQLRKNLGYSPRWQRQFPEVHYSRAARQELRRLSRNLGQPVEAVVQVRFVVSESGQVVKPETEGGVYPPNLPPLVLAAMHQLPRWNPARWEGVGIPSFCRATLKFATRGKVLIDNRFEAAETYNQLTAANFVQAFERQFTDSTLRRVSARGISSYLFNAAQLGWINCDRFINSPQPRITFVVNTGAANTDVKLLFKNMRSVLAGAAQGTNTYFPNVPENEPVTIVAIKQLKGITYLASQETTLSARTAQNLVFRPVSMTELKAEIARLDTRQ